MWPVIRSTSAEPVSAPIRFRAWSSRVVSARASRTASVSLSDSATGPDCQVAAGGRRPAGRHHRVQVLSDRDEVEPGVDQAEVSGIRGADRPSARADDHGHVGVDGIRRPRRAQEDPDESGLGVRQVDHLGAPEKEGHRSLAGRAAPPDLRDDPAEVTSGVPRSAAALVNPRSRELPFSSATKAPASRTSHAVGRRPAPAGRVPGPADALSGGQARRPAKSAGRKRPSARWPSICSRLAPVRSGMRTYTNSQPATLKAA